MGATGEAVYTGLFNTFVTIYYNQVVELNNALIGVAIMLAMIGDAITDPLVGIISDRWRSSRGRRHPFLWVAPIPLVIALWCVFNPPEFLLGAPAEETQFGLFLWLAVWTILGRGFLTLYSVPHLALGGELSKNQFQRSQLFSANTAIAYVSGASFAFIAWKVFFAGEIPRASDGAVVPAQLAAEAYGPLIMTACAVILIAIWSCAAGTSRHIPNLTSAQRSENRLTLAHFFGQIFSTLKNPNYRIILVGFFFFMIASGIYDTLNIFINTYFWQLPADKIAWLGLIGAPSAALGALLSPLLMRRFDRKPIMLTALAGTALFAQLVVNLRLLGLLPENQDPALMFYLLGNAAGFTFSLGLGTVAVLSMIGDIVDENELSKGVREEGLFYSARAFFAKASYSFGHLFAGIMLEYFVRLPFKAVPGELEADVLIRMGLTAGPIMGLAAVFSLLIYSRYNLPRERHQEILQRLKDRQNAMENVQKGGNESGNTQSITKP
ncbi:MFS transporter [Pseudomonadales bacterium]|nr:MFS transporter [Pseudomonadales bacterium]